MSRTGQTLSEYILAAALVALVGMGALFFMGDQIAGSLPGLLDRIFGDSGAAAGAPGGSGQAGSGAGMAATGDSVPVAIPGTRPVQITLANGQTLRLDNYPGDIAQSIETAGGNGTTKLLLANLDSIVRQLNEAGELTPEQFNAFQQLSNQGHKLAEAERLIEQAALNSVTTEEFKNKPIVFNGVTYANAYELKDLELNFQKSDGRSFTSYEFDANLDPLHTTAIEPRPGSEVEVFVSLYKDLESSGALSDPGVNQVVSSLSSEIAVLTEMVHDGVNSVWQGEVPPDQITGTVAEIWTTSDRDSAGICKAGGGKDTGVHCP